MTSVAEALRSAAELLWKTSDTARLDAELLMAHALGISRSDLLLHHMQDEPPEHFAELVARRAACEPIAYIIGRQEFFGREFIVTPSVLIPRADSECVVEAALEACPRAGRVLDCGVGSGALLLTVLAEQADARGVGIDQSAGALAVARRNAAQLGLETRAQMLERDWTVPGWAEGLGQFDLILANPPYVEEGAELAASVRGFEPRAALFAGPDGLDDYRALIPQLPEILSPNGILVMEIGSTQSVAVRQIAEGCGFSAEVRQDLGGRPRAVIMRLGLGKPVPSY